jgi:rubrerythrin
MELTIIVADETKSALEQRARERGYSDVSKYVERLISTDLLAAKSFDEILAPIRKTFQESSMSDGELEALFEEARDEVYQERKAQER